MDSFSGIMHSAERRSCIEGFSFSNEVSCTHSLFVDNLLLFGYLKRNHWFFIHLMFNRFAAATGLTINKSKSFIIYEYGDRQEIEFIAEFMGMDLKVAVGGFTYLGFRIKPCGYKKQDWT